MLTIRNYESIIGHTYNGWDVLNIEQNDKFSTRWMNGPHYIITLQRGDYGAGIIIERTPNPNKTWTYHLKANEWSNTIYESNVNRLELKCRVDWIVGITKLLNGHFKY